MPLSASARGRPRDGDREAAILQAVLACLADGGYERLSFEAVAHRAGSSKPTLYRRWSSKRDMVVAAVRSMPAQDAAPVIDSGSLRGDLLQLCDRLAETLTESDRGLVAALLQAGLTDAELCDHLETATGPTGARLPDEVLAHAVARGEVPAGASSFAYDEVVGSALVLRALNGLPFGARYREQLVDAVLLPALAAAPAPVAFAGIFAGSAAHRTEGDR